MSMHDDELRIDEATARGLVEAQFPQWRGREVRELVSAATVNAVFRVGPDLVARFPLRGQDPQVVRQRLASEAAAARELAAAATVPAPEPVALGEPGEGYPLPWSVQTWIEGHDAVVEDPAGSDAFAADLVALVRALRAVDTRGRTFTGTGRGGHLPDHDAWMQECFARSEGILDVPAARLAWAGFRELPEVDADVMCHGDLTPPNVLVRDRRLAGVLDGGGFSAADPALDLVAAWHLLDDGPRSIVREELGVGDVQWARGMAWAFQQAMGLVWYYRASNPAMSRWGRRTLDRVLRGRPPV